MNTDNSNKRSSSDPPERLTVIGCGILHREIRFLIEKNSWPLDAHFLDSTLHNNLSRLSASLEKAITENRDKNRFVFYGTCHPLMDRILHRHHLFRTEGQNCIDILLGPERFQAEVEKGAFFLLRDWAVHWSRVMKTAYPHCRPEVIREIFTSDRKYFLGVRTPCANDFEPLAINIASDFKVPLRWLDVELDHLESVLETAMANALESAPCV